MTDPFVDDPTEAFRKGTSRRAYRASAARELVRFLAGDEAINLRPTAPVRVSVIVILFNQAALTLRCLRRLAAEPQRDFETIIVDNRSSDDTGALLARVNGAKVLVNDENIGFLRAVNEAALGTAGDTLLLLNNDALPFPGAIRQGRERLENDPSIGVVGGRIITARGRLQEAGPIVWRDAKAVGFGFGRRPDAPQYRILREVDYTCGAFLLTPRRVFESLGGLDGTFAPAYYEEMDYCFRVRAAGRRVVYDPDVRVFHLGFGSAADMLQPLNRMRRNRRKMVDAHEDALGGRPSPSIANYLRACAGRKTGPWRLIVGPRTVRTDDETPAASLARRQLDAGGFATVVSPGEALGPCGAGFFSPGADGATWTLTPEIWSLFDEIVLLSPDAGGWFLEHSRDLGARAAPPRVVCDACGFSAVPGAFEELAARLSGLGIGASLLDTGASG